MSKFKVGDRVRVLSGASAQAANVGDTVTIALVDPNQSGRYESTDGSSWLEHEIELEEKAIAQNEDMQKIMLAQAELINSYIKLINKLLEK